MTLEELRDLNRVTDAIRAGVRAGTLAASSQTMPYYGYLTVDVFDCPPFVMFTNNDSPTVAYIIREGTFERCAVALWCALAREATGIIDIGANVGIYSLCAAMLRPDLSVHAFEPNPYAYARLRMHKHVNECVNLVEHAVGLADKETLFQLNWAVKPGGNIASGAGLGGVPSDAPTEHAIVQVTTLDRTGIAPTLGARPLIKIDVEGAEGRVFRGAKDLLVLRPDMIVECLDRDTSEELNQILLPLGYAVYVIHEDERELRRGERLAPVDVTGNLNLFLTMRSPGEIKSLRLRDVAVRG